jgi:hypothetical protein
LAWEGGRFRRGESPAEARRRADRDHPGENKDACPLPRGIGSAQIWAMRCSQRGDLIAIAPWRMPRHLVGAVELRID